MLYITRKKYYKMVNQFSHLENDQDVIDMYPKMFEALCCYNFHLPKRIVKSLFEDLGYGNWEHLWCTEEEKKRTISEWCEYLRWEVFYCSDRMTWDRLLRTHWLWQNIQFKLQMEEYEND